MWREGQEREKDREKEEEGIVLTIALRSTLRSLSSRYLYGKRFSLHSFSILYIVDPFTWARFTYAHTITV